MSDQTSASATDTAENSPPRWKPLGRLDRRVAGVLVEKAKTTPDQYPMTLNGLVNGCNQKSNRDPQMQIEESDVLDSLDRLKSAGAVIEIQGSGRVAKFRHLLYEWLGVDKVELAVMAELLLRGAQTEGELRGRAARMEPIADLNVLRGILDSLRTKRLVQDLTPPGRGQILSHGLYEPDELERLKAKVANGRDFDSAPTTSVHGNSSSGSSSSSSDRLSEELRLLRTELGELRRELEELSSAQRRQESELAQMRASLGG